MKIGILYIATGKYDIFFEKFYQSCENNFLTNHKKTYYVWTDSEKEIFNKPNVNKIFLKKAGWPYDTMMRFHHFTDASNVLRKNDFLFFFNANMIINRNITENDINLNNKIVTVDHPYFYDRHNSLFPYERNMKSNVSIPYGEGEFYVQGCFNGGNTEEFLRMSEHLSSAISNDLNNNIIPIWHDESALNWWIYKQNYESVDILDPGFAYPESIELPFEKKIIQLDKTNYGGHNYLRQ